MKHSVFFSFGRRRYEDENQETDFILPKTYEYKCLG